jgi:type I restriction enzyme S subunit
MKAGWELKKLGDEVVFQRGLTYSKKDEVDYSKNVVLRSNNVDLNTNALDFSELRYINAEIDIPEDKRVKKDSLIICTANGSKSHLGKVALINEDLNYAFGGFMGLITPSNTLNSKFLFYILVSEGYKKFIKELSDGANINNLKFSDLAKFEIPLPPLLEQQRIVSILDRCFTAIDQAKAHAEQNLRNARELFESYLNAVFENKGEGWEEQSFELCFRLRSGDGLTAKEMSEGTYPVFGGNGIAGYHNMFNLSGSNVIIGRVGALCGNVRHITEDIWLTDNAFKIFDFKFDFDHSFLTYLLNYKNLRSYARQAAQPVISNSSLKNVVLNFPRSIKQQQSIVYKLDALRAETQRLEAVYKKKIQDLEELRKSVLEKAFRGELSESRIVTD